MTDEERDRIAKLETITEERWNAHDKRSDEIWGEIKTDLSLIKKQVSLMPCMSHIEKFKHLEWSDRWLWRVLVGLIMVLIGAWVKGLA